MNQSRTKSKESKDDSKQFRIWNRTGRWTGLTQMSMVESALCPLDPQVSKRPNLRHSSQFYYYGNDGKKKRGTAEITAVYGLSPSDEFYLWGLLALTFAQPNPEPMLCATPHYCLTELGVVAAGGKNYENFRGVLKRLSGLTYSCDAFYDPIRKERCEQTIHILSFAKPIEGTSTRVWRIGWNQFFFNYVAAGDGHFGFDLGAYRQLDPACRRLFLLLRKVFHRRRSIRFNMMDLAVNQLGYSCSLQRKHLKHKLKQCLKKLLNLNVLSLGRYSEVDDLFETKKRAGEWVVLLRGEYFSNRRPSRASVTVQSAAAGPLESIGFTSSEIGRLIRQFKLSLVQEWADITLAARERNGPSFFKKNAKAYFRDNIKAAAMGNRTPPDWWATMRRQEEKTSTIGRDRQIVQELFGHQPEPNGCGLSSEELNASYEAHFQTVFDELIRSGLDPVDARTQAGIAARNRTKADQNRRRRKAFDLSSIDR